jgi:isopentenyldiphosphate isomerase
MERIDIVDGTNKVIGQAERSEVRAKKLLYRSSGIVVLNREGKLFVQKRADDKDLWPSMYEIGVGETPIAGEGQEAAAHRGLIEEIGTDGEIVPVGEFSYRGADNNENMRVYACVIGGDVSFADGEVSEGMFVTIGELKRMMKHEQFVPLTPALLGAFEKKRLLAIVDDDDAVVAVATFDEMLAKALTFRSANIFVFNSSGELFVHKRSKNLPTFAGKWDVKLGGIVDAGETYEEAATRELAEEAGIRDTAIEFLFPLKHRTSQFNNNRRVYKCVYDGKMTLQESEIEEGKFVSMDEVLKMRDDGLLSESAERVLEAFLEWKR